MLFSTIFLALGSEHLWDDHLIQQMMPTWLPAKHFFSTVAGMWLLVGGAMVFLGYRLRFAGYLLGTFLIVVTFVIHAPNLIAVPPDLAPEWHWLWNVYQRSNFVKNLCLLGVCFHLIHHEVGCYSLDTWRKKMK
jgi:uncharacterized membrane protein YphA (DoxX/SURF4 family)